MYLKADKPWDGDGMYGQAFRLKLGLSKSQRWQYVRIDGYRYFVDSVSCSSDVVSIRDGNKTVRFHRAELDWVGEHIPRRVRGKWTLSSVTTTTEVS